MSTWFRITSGNDIDQVISHYEPSCAICILTWTFIFCMGLHVYVSGIMWIVRDVYVLKWSLEKCLIAWKRPDPVKMTLFCSDTMFPLAPVLDFHMPVLSVSRTACSLQSAYAVVAAHIWESRDRPDFRRIRGFSLCILIIASWLK